MARNIIIPTTVLFLLLSVSSAQATPVTANAVSDWDITSGSALIQDGDEYRIVSVFNDADLTISGGDVSSLGLFNNSISNMSGGSAGDINAFNNSQIIITNGRSTSIHAYDSSSVHLHRVERFVVAPDIIWTPGVSYSADGEIHYYGYDFEFLTPGPGSGWLTGKWADGTSFQSYLRAIPDPFESSNIILHVVPEPSGLLMIITGYLLIRRKLRIRR